VAVSATGSRRSFIGEGGSLAEPAALRQRMLDQRFGTGVDPCAALQLTLVLEPEQEFTCAFLLGEAADAEAARACADRYTLMNDVDGALMDVQQFWRELLGRVQVRTPVPALDRMFNGWLAYQNLACRMWARSAFYQSGGAYGFRDQLQDSSALLYLDPSITRRQILLHAAHQFVEGDVLHWWHPPAGKGIRTRFSDDLLWLPQITQFYVARTGDTAILDENVGFVQAEQLAEGEDERFVWAARAAESASLYEHCSLALDRSLTKGVHGLPLMGVGDWNDGMNRVGREGKGESVWLGFFLFDILSNWLPICEQRGDRARAQRYRAYRRELHAALNDGGWDGSWYRRAYYDNGAPLGSAQNDECRIDALAQAWAVISRAAPEQRAAQALAAMREQLVDEAAGIIRLLTPAFDKTPHDPGYIKGYVPGVRENGGQYTHAALWAVRALAEYGAHDVAAKLLEMISPVTRSAQPDVYRGEPYVVAADVYGEPPHVGRAGWTWYTGSAGWLYRVLLESILGFELVEGREVWLRPCLPDAWPGYTLDYRFADGTIYHFVVERSERRSKTSSGKLDDGAIVIPLVLDGGEHTVRIRAGADVRPRYRPRSSDAPLLRTTSA
jgi:cyclic beta-1,2-glucan synthetase